MAVQKGKPSGLVAKLGQKLIQAHNAAKDQDTDYGNLGDLPAGINGGVAQLEDIKIAVHPTGHKKAGEYYFYAGAIVVTPAMFEGMQTAGMRTMITTPLHDTPERSSRKTFADHWAWMLNELRKMGVETKTLKPDDIEAVLDALREQKPYIRFRTWKGEPTPQYPNPRVNHEWGGLADYSGDVDQIGAVEDSSGGESTQEDDTTTVEEAQQDESSELDLEALASAADNGDEDAQTKLGELAEEYSITEDQIKEASDYAELAGLIQTAMEGGDTQEEEGGWKVGEACLYAPKDPKDKTGRKRLKKTQCSILEINGDGTVVTLKNLDDPKKKYKDVSVNEIEPA